MQLFDCECSIGKLKTPQPGSFSSALELVAEMEYYGIDKALVYHSLAKEYNAAFGNSLLCESIGEFPRLHGCWILQPHFTGEMPAPEIVAREMLQKGIRTARLFPGDNGQRFSLSHWSCGRLFEVLAEHRIPVFVDKDLIQWDEIANICRSYPALPLVITEVWCKETRYVYPLFEQFPNFHISLSRFIGHQCLEDVCRRFGSGGLLFGSKMPVFTPGPVIAMLTYAEISEKEKSDIAADNLRRLLDEVA